MLLLQMSAEFKPCKNHLFLCFPILSDSNELKYQFQHFLFFTIYLNCTSLQIEPNVSALIALILTLLPLTVIKANTGGSVKYL